LPNIGRHPAPEGRLPSAGGGSPADSGRPGPPIGPGWPRATGWGSR